MHWLAIAFGGALGAMSRAYLSGIVGKAMDGTFPFGTLAVNILGSFIMGMCYVLIVEHLEMPGYWREIILVGFLGALTTFSTFSLESLTLIQHNQWHLFLIYTLGSVIGCIIACYLGWQLARWFV